MEEKVSFADFAAAKHEKAVWDYFWEAERKGHRYHKMAVCEKLYDMTHANDVIRERDTSPTLRTQ